MGDTIEERGRFWAALDLTPRLWGSFEVATIAVSHAGMWRNLLTVITLLADDLPPSWTVLATTEHVMAVRERRSIPFLPGVIDEISRGQTTIAESTVSYWNLERPPGAPVIRKPYSYAWTSIAANFQDAPFVAGRAFGHSLTLNGDPVSTHLEHVRGGRELLDAELRAASEPWDGVDALLHFGLRTRRRIDASYAASVVVLAPLDTRLNAQASQYREGDLNIVLHSDSRNASLYSSLGYVTTRNGEMAERASYRVPEEAWVHSALGSVANVQLTDATGDAVAVFARVGPYVTDRATLPNAVRLMNRPQRSEFPTTPWYSSTRRPRSRIRSSTKCSDQPAAACV